MTALYQPQPAGVKELENPTCEVCDHHKAAHDNRGCTQVNYIDGQVSNCRCIIGFDFKLPPPTLPPEKPKKKPKKRFKPVPPAPPRRGSTQRRYLTGKFPNKD